MPKAVSWSARGLLSILSVFLVFLIACTTSQAGPPGQARPDAPSGGSSPSPLPVSVPQGELRVNLGGEPPTIDPSRSSTGHSITVVQQLFEGLLTFQPDLSLAAAVAREVPSVQNGGISKDLLTYTFRLRDDAKWSDGRSVTAGDFEYSIKRLLDPKTAASYASFYSSIKGAKDYATALGTKAQPKQADDATLARLRDAVAVRATDDRTLVVELAQPRLTFLQLMALWPAFPLRRDVIEAKGDQWTEAGNLIGNGPFLLAEWVHQERITLTPNSNYVGNQPRIAKVSLSMLSDANADFAAYRAGEREMTNVSPTIARQVLADPVLKPEVLRYTDLATFAYQFNTRKAPFDNPPVRQAFSKAINREAFVDKVSFGVGRPAYSWVPPGMPGHDPNLGKDVHAFDPAKAKELLAQAGFAELGKLPPISFQYASSTANQLRAEFFQGQIRDHLGIDVRLEPMESAAFSRAVNSGDFHVAFLGWSADYPDPDNWLPDIFGTNGGTNRTRYSNPKFDDLAGRAMAEPDTSKRLGLWTEAQRVVIEDTPIIPLIYRERLWLVKPTVKGLTTTAGDSVIPGDHFLGRVSVDKP